MGLEIGVNLYFCIVCVCTSCMWWRYKTEGRGINSRWRHWNFFSLLSASGLGSTKLLSEMSTRNVSWGGKDYQCVELTPLPSPSTDCFKICKLSWTVQTCTTTALLLCIYTECTNVVQ
jgi:hypothetical protein